MRHVKGFDRNQIVLIPETIDKLIEQDNLVRVIDVFVDSLDFETLGFNNLRPPADGRPPYHPGDLLKLYMYGYLNRTRSSRDLEKECKRNVEVIWLLKGLKPDHNTVSNFRRDNPKAIKKVFRQTVSIAKNLDLIGGVLIAGDSTKFRAQNSKKNNYNKKKIERHLAYIDNKIEQYNKALGEADGDQEKKEIREEIDKHNKQKKHYKQVEQQLDHSGEKQVSTSDPDTRQLIVRNNITEVAYNVQASVDARHNIPIDYKVTNQNDRNAMANIVARSKSILRSNQFTALFDKGYHNAGELNASNSMGVETIVAIPGLPSSAKAPDEKYNLANFIYSPSSNTYMCPEGHTLTTNGNWYLKRTYKVRHYKTKTCRTCPAKELCTKARYGRVVERHEHAGDIDLNRKRLMADPQLYKRRQAIVEHPFGTIKRQWGFNYIVTKKGMDKAEADIGLVFIAYNFRRLLSIIGKKKLIHLINTPVNHIIRCMNLYINRIKPFQRLSQIVSPKTKILLSLVSSNIQTVSS